MFLFEKSVLGNKKKSYKKHLVGMYELNFRNQIILHNKL